MGSPLGPTFADFYMSAVEHHLLSQEGKLSNPTFYARYVDDIFCIFQSKHHIRHFINRLHNNSVLKFTVEHMTENTFNFLDLKLKFNTDGTISTGVFIKPTDKGIYSSYHSYSPEMYKRSLVKTLVLRAIKYSHSWPEFHSEISRLKQIFCNNNFPQNITENIIKNTINKYINTTEKLNNHEHIQFYVHLPNLLTFNTDKKTLNNILTSHLTPTDNNNTIFLHAYFKPFKLSALFSTRDKPATKDKTNVVYQFQCSQQGCQALYIGYTTNSLSTRCKQHRYKQSNIYMHYFYDHQSLPPTLDDFINNFTILHSFNNVIDLKLAEAIEIRKNNPFINVKYNENYNLLNLFK